MRDFKLDHPDPAHCLVSGAGLTHLGSASQRAEMHAQKENKTDSEKMFEMGLEGGKPATGRGVQPEWFYKGDGQILRGPNEALEPTFLISTSDVSSSDLYMMNDQNLSVPQP